VNLDSLGLKLTMVAIHVAALVVGIAGGIWFFDTFTQ
jgi:hypothetical protein